MPKPKIAVFSGPRATVTNSPPLVTSNKARLPGEPTLPGRFDHLVGQLLHEPVTVRIQKFTAHPLEEDAKHLYHDDGLDHYEVELRPEDGPYLLPYMARRNDGSSNGAPFGTGPGEDGRQHHYPDASRVFADIDRTISGRGDGGVGNALDNRAEYDFIRVLPPGGYTLQGEVPGVDFFASGGPQFSKFPTSAGLARAANMVQAALASGEYVGGLWMEGSPTVEETLYWLGLLIDTDLPIAGAASQRPHGQLANDGDRNLVDAVDYILSGQGNGVGSVGVLDEQLFASREFKKADDRPGNYKATGGHGGILGTVGPPVTLWYRPNYRHYVLVRRPAHGPAAEAGVSGRRQRQPRPPASTSRTRTGRCWGMRSRASTWRSTARTCKPTSRGRRTPRWTSLPAWSRGSRSATAMTRRRASCTASCWRARRRTVSAPRGRLRR